MIKRFVILTLRNECVAEFLELFVKAKKEILLSKSCRHLELLQDSDHPNVFISFSIWDSEAELHKYRNSETFLKIWERVQQMFSDEPRAITTKVAG